MLTFSGLSLDYWFFVRGFIDSSFTLDVLFEIETKSKLLRFTKSYVEFLKFFSRDTSMETTTSSSLPPPFTPDDIREASLNLSQEQRQRPIPKARSIENIADVSTSSSEQG